ncbi:hypothetical protein CMV_000329 [Castanea mollissima]|uniref:Uncharacterized protein n=1 Tax=Castanea mollissima TaxID=60419 RepID=A0A8J4S1K1_9ROSI|nr:hypothetical protein CMV_000329 [Castanea mollissima]
MPEKERGEEEEEEEDEDEGVAATKSVHDPYLRSRMSRSSPPRRWKVRVTKKHSSFSGPQMSDHETPRIAVEIIKIKK